MTQLIHRELSDQVIGAMIEVHRELGPGLLESAYEECLCHELSLRDLAFERQVQIPMKYKRVRLACGFVADIIVDQKILLELKSVEEICPVHEAQLITYLKLTGLRVGLLANFNVPIMKSGITRRVV